MNTNPTATVKIPTGDDKPVWADLYTPAHERSTVILCHGLKGYRRWGFIPLLARTLADSGFGVVAIDFSHNGMAGGDGGSSGGRVYKQPELFRRNTLDRERNDLAAVIRWVRERTGMAVRPGLWGHSRGGGSVVLNALSRPGDISAIVTWSVPAHADIYKPRQKKRWREAGEYDFLESASGERLAMGIEYLDDLEARHDEYALADRAAGLDVPHLVVHGDMDLVIPAESADRFFRAAPARAEKQILKLRTGHTFGIARSPRSGPLVEAINATVEWFRRFTPDLGENK